MASYFNYGIHKVAIKRDTFNTVSGNSHLFRGGLKANKFIYI